MSAAAAQIIVAIIGFIGAMIPHLLQARRQHSQGTTPAAAGAPTPSDKNGAPDSTARVPAEPSGSRSITDLAIQLVCAAGFCVLLADSLLISGREPTLSMETLVGPVLTALVVTGVTYIAWRAGKSELTLGILAFSTAVVLVLSPGSAFFQSSARGEKALPLPVPLFVLAALVASSIVYQRGRTFMQRDRSRWRIYGGLGLVALAGAVCIGMQSIARVQEDENNPTRPLTADDLPHVKSILEQLRELSPRLRARFYQIASEATLSPYYAQKYFQIRSAFDAAGLGPTSTRGADATPTSLSPSAEPTTAPAPVGTAGTPAATPVLTPASSPTSSPSPTSTASPSKRVYSSSDEEGDQLAKTRERFHRLEAIFAAESSRGAARLPYLLDRAQWVHSTGSDPDLGTADHELPGLTVIDRLEGLVDERNKEALDHKSNQVSTMLETFAYPTEVQNHFTAPSHAGLSLKPKFTPPNQIFPALPQRDYTPDLLEQLALPSGEDGYLAYREYLELARDTALPAARDAIEAYRLLPTRAQKAFLGYVATAQDRKPRFEILAKLARWHANASSQARPSFAALRERPYGPAELADVLGAGPIDGTSKDIAALAEFTRGAMQGDGADLAVLRDLLRSARPDAPLGDLFDDPLFALVSQVFGLEPNGRDAFFTNVSDPAGEVARQAVSTLDSAARKSISELLGQFLALSPSQREAVLHFQAIAIFRPSGPHSLDPLDLLYVRMGVVSPLLAVACAAVLALPIMSLALLLGAYLAFAALGRDLLRKVIDTERAQRDSQRHTIVYPVERLVGRDDVLERLTRLANRGSSTIALVGRRGVGKTRILHNLYTSRGAETPDGRSRGLSVWIAAPARFDEEEFIASVLERLAVATEEAVAQRLAAAPQAVRRLEGRLARGASWAAISGVLLVAGLICFIGKRTERSEVVLALLPAGVILLVALACWLVDLVRLQPVDLAPWLSRDRSQSPHTVLLYRAAADVLRFIEQRRVTTPPPVRARVWEALRTVALCLGGLILLVTSAIGVTSGDFDSDWAAWMLVGLLTCAVAGYVRPRGPDPSLPRGVMSLVARYREFAEIVVHRLRAGALGAPSPDASIWICVDELDKIVRLQEIRAFLRRIKAIFEVPGVYYYLSLAEDSLRSLYLGPSSGKTEIDSSIDHVVRVEPLGLLEGAAMSQIYLETRGLPHPSRRLPLVLSLLSFGVARDMLRHCDEILANPGYLEDDRLAKYVGCVRKQRAELGHESGLLTKSEAQSLAGPSGDAIAFARTMVGTDRPPSSSDFVVRSRPTQRLALELWLLAIVELLDATDGPTWQTDSRGLADLGYLIPTRAPGEVAQPLDEITRRVMPRAAE